MCYETFLTLELGDKVRDKRTGEVGEIQILSKDEIYVAFDENYLTFKEDYYKIREWAKQYPIIYQSVYQYTDEDLDKADGHSFPIWNTNRLQDVLLAQWCPFKIVQNRLKEVYGEEYHALRHESWIITCIKALLDRSLYSQRDSEDNRNPQLCWLLKHYLQTSYVSTMIGNYLHLKDISIVTAYRLNYDVDTITVFITAYSNKPTSIEIGKKNFFRFVRRLHSEVYDKYLDPIMNLEWVKY